MTMATRDSFATPIQVLYEDIALIKRQIQLQQHQGESLERAREMIADNQNAIDTLESLRE